MPNDKSESKKGQRASNDTQPRIFVGASKSVRSLRRYYKRIPDAFDEVEFIKELSGESHRAATIILAALLEDALQTRLIASLKFKPNESDIDHIFRFEGPLGTFSSRVEIGLLFGAIDNQTYSQLNSIREMRNACAHAQRDVTFSHAALANVALRLFQPIGNLPAPINPKGETLRAMVIFECMIIYLTLMHGSRRSARIRVSKAILEVRDTQPPSRDISPQQ